MSDEKIRSQLMDYLYDEMDEVQKRDFDALLASRPDLQKEYNDLREMRELLSSSPSAIPEYKPDLPVQSGSSTDKRSYDNRDSNFSLNSTLKTIFAIAASILIILVGSSLAGLNMGQTEAGFYLTFGELPAQPVSGITEEQVYELIEQMHVEQTVILTRLLEQAQNHQNQQFNEVLTLLTNYYDERREQDLMMIAEGIDQLEAQTHHRFNYTNAALGDIIYAISNP